ncbi:hypothetical protein SAMN00790413_05125 [Deinococcus hopiensis KR-140]|uniref:Uncharacterized protein n=1 Tax=Deinococcus hopiensis KR-140 TaxID=695939 RepID=A0A1W1UTP9_9DEIO|nr:hypothetical protein SAMN00790413_05125 [Deinococcus hopiensis KR-140]
MTEAQTRTPTQAAPISIAAFTTGGDLDRFRPALQEARGTGTPSTPSRWAEVRLEG